MAYEIKPGNGSIFRNQYKKEDKHPDYKGQVRTPDGQLLDVACWLKEGKNGKFFSVSLKAPRDDDGAPSGRTPPAGSIDEDIPF